mgnify:CR=1 FL=1
MLTNACCVGIIVPLICLLGDLAAIFDDLTGQLLVALPPLGAIVRNIQASLDEA